MRLVAVLNVLSRVLLLFAASMALPWGLSYALGDGAQQAFGHALAATLASALVLWLITFHERRELQVRDGFLLVALVWTVLPAFATLPLLFSLPGLRFTDAYFEAVSGLTASGGTVLLGLDSPAIEAVAIAFMLVAAMNFATHFLAWRRLSLSAYRRDPEAKAMIAVLAVCVLLVAGYLVLTGVYEDFGTALRYSAFNVVSLATTTGYANTDYGQWPIFAPLLMLFLSSFASCSGSTGSGMKMIRAQILFKQIFRELLRTIHPRVYSPVKLSERPISNATVFAVLAYVFVYVSCVIALTLLLTASGLG